MKINNPLSIIVLYLGINGCDSSGANNYDNLQVSSQFGSYWYQGEAELNHYTLEQVRYGQIHEGHAVLIFVTEDFSRSKHVKLDQPASAGEDKINVLKLNFTKKFTTGIYPYSMMLSVFTPAATNMAMSTLKSTATSQEWCGHTFTQLDLENNRYQGHLYSYFEAEGSETDIDLEDVWLEDEIWNLIRLNPDLLPTGTIQIIPGMLSQRLMHSKFEVQSATAQILRQNEQINYTIRYSNLQRELKINFKNKFPYQITGWEETSGSATDHQSSQLITRARLKENMMLDYWNKNQKADSIYRKELLID